MLSVCLFVCYLFFSFFICKKSGNNSQNLFQNCATNFEKRVLPTDFNCNHHLTLELVRSFTIILIFIVQLLNALYQPMAYSWDVTRTPQRCHLAQNVGSLVRKELMRSVQQSGNVQRMEPGVVWTSSVQV